MRATEMAVSAVSAGGDRLCDLDRTPRDYSMQQLDHATIDGEDALALVLRLCECRDDLPSPLHLGGRRGKDFVGRRNLIGVDQRLAVHAELAALDAFPAEALDVLVGIVDAFEDVDSMSARRGDCGG